METTRHFVATAYIVNDGATALHEHKRLGLRLPPGGHIDRGELPHEAALREAREETGLDPTLLTEYDADITSPTARSVPRPRHVMLEDINVCDGEVGHQHVDHIFYATVDSRDIRPRGDDEVDSGDWAWYTPRDLRKTDLDPDAVQLGLEAIEAAAQAGE